MLRLHKKQIIVGVSGGIAAYKSADLVRRLQDQGAIVRVVMTQGAQAFITPLTLQALSGFPVHTDLLDTNAEAAMGHIELARWADLVLVAPASANTISRLCHGAADDLLTTLCLATKAPVAISPAMNQAMWHHPNTQANLDILRSRGTLVIEPGIGSQACGDIGPGRMPDSDILVNAAIACFEQGPLDGIRVLLTAGPTREAIDPVRYISNHSSGKMGYALAEKLAEAGAQVTLISGPVALETPPRIDRVNVISAADMFDAVMQRIDACDVFIAAAAVADYTPAEVARQKMKKGATDMSIALVKTTDIVASVAALPNKPITIGFAAETDNVLAYAKDKLQRKGLDMIIANDVSDSKIGFNSDENAVTVITPDSDITLEQRPKRALATSLVEQITQLVATRLAP
ncbi:MAG TPA: bifunctional phosphopantothenoylcysteine decarboxylase/phosphopantothenate--cysteine ligase CoaBC [Pseudomonadales bacterium]|nr:bifunctional phosphopantothenoylcysteine decarboxylase/phosphopantothenate--cysteine ligase CoaBC [Pseudomonadales bacterium]